MSKELQLQVVPPPKPLTGGEIKAQVNMIQDVMRKVMKEGHHYGKIPGTGDKPTLLKPGSEKILMTFHMAVDPIVTDLSTEDERRYRVLTRILSSSGSFLGAGVGECSSDEEKYKWRKVICPEEFDDTPEDRRREVWKKGYQGAKASKVKQVRTNPADIANTVLKMAKKRAQIDGTLTVTAASDIFGQDYDEMTAETREQVAQGEQKEAEVKSSSVQPKKTEEKKPEKLTEYRKKLWDLLCTTFDSNPPPIKIKLVELTSFTVKTGKDKGKIVAGKDDITKISEAMAKVAYGKLKTEVEAAGVEAHPAGGKDDLYDEKKCTPCTRLESCMMLVNPTQVEQCNGPYEE